MNGMEKRLSERSIDITDEISFLQDKIKSLEKEKHTALQ